MSHFYFLFVIFFVLAQSGVFSRGSFIAVATAPRARLPNLDRRGGT